MMNSNFQPILPGSILEEHEAAARKANELKGKICSRIDYIWSRIFKTFGESFEWWCFADAAEGEVGCLRIDDIAIRDFEFDRCLPDFEILLKDGTEWGLWQIPTRWLFEDFEQELVEGKLALELKRLKCQQQIKRTAAQKEQIKKQALEKLSQEERKALGF